MYLLKKRRHKGQRAYFYGSNHLAVKRYNTVMLLFFDESYEVQEETGALLHAYAGFAIRQDRYRTLVAAMYQRKLRYFVPDTDLSAVERQEARRSGKIIVAGAAEKAEMKGEKLLTEKQARFHVENNNAPGILMAEELLTVLAELECTVFASLSTPASMREIQTEVTLLPVYLIRLLERIEHFMQEQNPNKSAVIVLDRVKDDEDKNLSECLSDFLFRSSSGKRMRHLVPNPFWVDSKTTAGSQTADILAHILMNSMRPDATRKPLDNLWRKVAAMEYRSRDLKTRGIRRINNRRER